MPSLLPEGKQKFFGNDGRPLVGGKILTFAAGTNTPKPTFTDSAGTTPQTNPVILDSRGEALVFWDGAYKVQLTDALNNILWTVDNIRELVPDYRTSSTGSIVTPVGTTAQRDLNPAIGFFRFNTTINGFEGFVSGQWRPIIFDSADVTLSFSSTVGGAVKLDNPGGATRTLTQWNGASYAGFTLGAGAFQAPYLYTGLSACYFGVDAGGGNPGISFDTSDYMDYNRTSNTWRLVMGGAEIATASAVDFVISTPAYTHRFAGSSTKFTFNTAAPLDQKYWSEITGLSQIVKFIYNDSFSVANPYDTVSRAGANLTTRQLNQSSGRLLVGQGLTDDGVTALQTTSYSASNQPSLVGGFSSGFINSTGGIVSLPINTRVLKGGMTVSASNLIVTVPVAGTYLVTGSTAISSASGSTTRLLHGVGISVNGAIDTSAGSTFLSNAEQVYIVSSRSISLLAGDTISLIGFCSGSPNSGFQAINFSIIKIN